MSRPNILVIQADQLTALVLPILELVSQLETRGVDVLVDAVVLTMVLVDAVVLVVVDVSVLVIIVLVVNFVVELVVGQYDAIEH